LNIQMSRIYKIAATTAWILSASLFGVHASPSLAYSVNNYHGYYNHYWEIANYDFNSQYNLTGSGVDNPVTLIFKGNASQSKIYNLLQSVGYTDNNTGGAYGYGVYWDEYYSPGNQYIRTTQGEKTPPGCGVTDKHVRYYGDFSNGVGSYSALYDPYWGWFLFASTHLDKNDVSCSSQYPKTFGWQEDAETWVTNDISNSPMINQSTSYNDYVNFNNVLSASQPAGTSYGSCAGTFMTGYLADNSHCLENDGYASWVDMK